MKTRIITALVLIPILVLVLVSNNFIISLAVALVSLMGLFEFYKATGIIQKKALCGVGFLLGAGTVLRFYIPVELYMPLFFVMLMLIFVVMLKDHKSVSVSDSALVLFGVLYVPFLLSTLTSLARLQGGLLFLWMVFIGAFATDTFAYFSGYFFGKHKLCPEISPKKTIEGSVGGTLGCVVLLIVYGIFLEKQFGQSINYIKLAILGILIAAVSQIGDLTASIIKRKYGVKDYGSLFPGHGGILDRLDSIITTAPLVYCFITTIGL